MKTKKESGLHKAYKACVELSQEARNGIVFLSQAMIQLWNIAQKECESRLDEAQRMRAVMINLRKNGGSALLKFRDGAELMCNDVSVVLAKQLLNEKCSIAAISLNFWLTDIRRQSITLADGANVALSDISVDVEREVLRKLAGSYKSFFELKKKKDKRARKPGPKEAHWFQTLSWSSFGMKDGVLCLPGYKKERIEITLTSYLLERITNKEIVHATIARNYEGRFELSLVTSSPMPETPAHPTFFRAIDLGAGDIAVTDSDGSEFLIPARRPDKYWRQKVRHIEARVRLRNKGSRGHRRLMKARRHILNKSRDQHTSHQRKLAHALVEPKIQCLVLGKPQTRLGLAKSEGIGDQHWGAQNTGYMFRLLLYIKEKAAECGVKVLEFPDPHREGGLEEPENKLKASRALLEKSLVGTEIPIPTAFKFKSFSFKQ